MKALLTALIFSLVIVNRQDSFVEAAVYLVPAECDSEGKAYLTWKESRYYLNQRELFTKESIRGNLLCRETLDLSPPRRNETCTNTFYRQGTELCFPMCLEGSSNCMKNPWSS